MIRKWVGCDALGRQVGKGSLEEIIFNWALKGKKEAATKKDGEGTASKCRASTKALRQEQVWFV